MEIEITDNYIIGYFYINGKINSNKIKHYNKIDEKTDQKIYDYLINRFDENNETTTIQEILFRIKNKIYKYPTCLECGNPVKFAKNHYHKFCCSRCSNINKDKIKKERQTKLDKYGNEKYNNREKYHQTCLEKYGDENYTNREKYHQTCLEKYGAKDMFSIDEIQNKIKINIKNKYNVDNISKLDEIKEKKRQTCLNNFGVNYGFNTELAKNNLRIKYKKNKDEIIEKIKRSKLDKYGNENFVNPKKTKQTCFKKYGVDNVFKLEKLIQKRLKTFKSIAFKEKISKILSSQEVQNKINATKRKNNSFSTSKPEEESYLLLKEKYNDVKRQYKSEEYPYLCDFYIPSLDLYIECNYHWTHGNHAYDPTNIEDNLLLEKWKQKPNSFYDSAIKVWSISDVIKRNLAKENKLNWIEFFSIDDFKKWLANN